MRHKASKLLFPVLGLLAAISFFIGCNETNELGMELLPNTDLVEVKNLVEKSNISSYTFSEGPIRTDKPAKSLLGSFYDPLFGKTTINFATQFRMQGYNDYGTNPVVDSVKLYLYYRLRYGDTITTQKFRIYELAEPIISDTINEKTGGSYDYPYFQDVDLKSMASPNLIGETDYLPNILNDTLYKLIPVHLDKSLGVKLATVDSLQVLNNDMFLEFFKGLYIESEEVSSEAGTILTLEAASDESYSGSALVVNYDNDENQAKEEPDTLMFNSYVVTELSQRVNSIKHDYTGTPFLANLDVETGEDSLIYIQATGGLKSKIQINNLESWKDSVNIGVNKAELVFQIDTIASHIENYPPPAQLLFTMIDENGKELLPADYTFYPTYYGGTLRSDYTYRFNIAQHMQQIIEGKIENNGFFLSTALKNSEARRVVLKGGNSETGIKLIITYSKFNQ